MYTFDSRIRYSETDETGALSLLGVINYLQDLSLIHILLVLFITLSMIHLLS